MSESNSGVAQDWQAIAKYIESLGHHLDAGFEPRQLSGGVANLNYIISMDGQRAVLRRPPDGPLPRGANDVAREYKVLSRLGDHFKKAPNGLVFCDDMSVIGVPFCISEFREGICIGRELPPSLREVTDIGGTLSEMLVSTLVELHKVDLVATELTDLGKIEGYLERQIEGWYKRGAGVVDEEQLQSLGQIKSWLSANLPQQRLGALVHNDFKLDNMLIDEKRLTVNGIVDWDMCTIGDPFYELAILLSYWGGESDIGVYSFQCRMPCEAPGWWSRQQVINRYIELSGFTIDSKDVSFYWWLTQYRNIVVYAQLKALFDRTGKVPAVVTQEECNGMGDFCDNLIKHVVDRLENDSQNIA